MKEFFKVTDLKQVLKYAADFPCVETEEIPLHETSGRILADDIVSDINLPDFMRSTMDGYAVRAQSTFGASEGNPAYLKLKGAINMGTVPSFTVKAGEAANIPTGGMLPEGADSVVMVEHTETIDDATIEVYRSVAPGQHVIDVGEDIKKGEIILSVGRKLRSQETGLLAALGKEFVKVYKRPVIGIISTGDEIVPITDTPGMGQIRDINTYTLSGLVKEAGGIPVSFGIVRDDFDDLFEKCSTALAQTDMALISGGSSVGMRDFTTEVLSSLPDSGILAHGISISPGKPTILAKTGNKAFWGLPGHVVSAMVVFALIVRPFIEQISGLSQQHGKKPKLTAFLSRNISSAQGRVDFVRIRLIRKDGVLWAEPVLGKSGLINTMVKADGMIEIGINTEGLDKGTEVEVIAL
ncbi:MAG: molybdopterin molybdotransferase MoeA [Deltaproteobacteria bacterium]|nr:molybdopterin molybdotransferase MoeA [Deltaproteobacteria bacterium]